MKPKIIKADTCGCMVKFPNDDAVYYVGVQVGDGYVYQDKKAFRNQIGICYIDKYGWFDEVCMDENVSDEMFELLNSGKLPSYHVTFAETGFTWLDLYELVYHWADNYDYIDRDCLDAFAEYFAGVLFANLVNGRPEDKLKDYNPCDEFDAWLSSDADPRLTDKQRKELYE